jgi:carboxymethylenebutenolidase
MTEMFTGLCDRLAEAGFVALVPDLYGGRTASTIAEAEALIKTLDNDEAIKDAAAAAERLLNDPQTRGAHIGGIGFSMGAAYLLWLATLQPALSATVVFYGGVDMGADFIKQASASILGHFAETDDYEPPAEEAMQLRDELQAAGMDVTFHVYPGTSHWFFEENRPDAYNSGAAKLAWERTLEFLQKHLPSEAA